MSLWIFISPLALMSLDVCTGKVNESMVVDPSTDSLQAGYNQLSNSSHIGLTTCRLAKFTTSPWGWKIGRTKSAENEQIHNPPPPPPATTTTTTTTTTTNYCIVCIVSQHVPTSHWTCSSIGTKQPGTFLCIIFSQFWISSYPSCIPKTAVVSIRRCSYYRVCRWLPGNPPISQGTMSPTKALHFTYIPVFFSREFCEFG